MHSLSRITSTIETVILSTYQDTRKLNSLLQIFHFRSDIDLLYFQRLGIQISGAIHVTSKYSSAHTIKSDLWQKRWNVTCTTHETRKNRGDEIENGCFLLQYRTSPIGRKQKPSQKRKKGFVFVLGSFSVFPGNEFLTVLGNCYRCGCRILYNSIHGNVTTPHADRLVNQYVVYQALYVTLKFKIRNIIFQVQSHVTKNCHTKVKGLSRCGELNCGRTVTVNNPHAHLNFNSTYGAFPN